MSRKKSVAFAAMGHTSMGGCDLASFWSELARTRTAGLVKGSFAHHPHVATLQLLI
jgi:hypothetical protein